MRQIGEIVTRYNRYSLQRSSQRSIVTRYNRYSLQRSSRERAQSLAKNMADKLGSEKDFNFFLKCAWHLSEDKINSIMEIATSGNKHSPLRYATVALKNALREQGL